LRKLYRYTENGMVSLHLLSSNGSYKSLGFLLISAQVAKLRVLENEMASRTSVQHEMKRFGGFMAMKGNDQVKDAVLSTAFISFRERRAFPIRG
jgi:hypothetical protein